MMVTVHSLPVVSIDPLVNDSVCNTSGLLTLPSATPLGGTFFGTGVTGNEFDPASAGIGNHFVYYTYTDSNGCFGVDTVSIYVLNCTGIEENANNNIILFPNPFESRLEISSAYMIDKINLFDLNGRLITCIEEPKNRYILQLAHLNSGSYIIEMISGNASIKALVTKSN